MVTTRRQVRVPMKVLHLINSLSVGGAELHLLTLACQLKGLGVDTVVACLGERAEGNRSLQPNFERAGIRVVTLGAESKWDWRFLGKVPALLKRESPDVLHTHLPRADFAALLGRLPYKSTPWVSSVHGHSNAWFGRRLLPIFNLVWRQPDKLIAISREIKTWLVDQRRIPPDKIVVVHYGIEYERFSTKSAPPFGNSSNRPYPVIGSIGRLDPVKSHSTLIKAMPLILGEAPRARLLIAGPDPHGYSTVLRSLISRLDLKEKVELVGVQTDIPAFLQSLDMFAFASRSEGFGQVIIEAMAAGRPVVASDIPPMNEIVIHDETGILIKPSPQSFADAFLDLLKNHSKAPQMGESGKQRVQEHFSAQKMTEQTMAIYEAVRNRSTFGR